LIDDAEPARFGRKNRQLKRSTIASVRIFHDNMSVFEATRRRRFCLSRRNFPLRSRRSRDQQKKERCAKLCHCVCSARPETAGRFATGPKSG
jgi:hypothetical protein